MATRVDRRTVHFESDEEALAEVADRRADWLEQEFAFARLFCRIDRQAAFVPAGCSSVQELASRRGYSTRHVRDLTRLGHALAGEPELEALLRANEIGFDVACALGRIHRDPDLPRPDDEWVQWARFERLAELNRRIRQRIEEVRQGCRDVRPWNAHVTARTAENLLRCRQIASQKAGRLLTHGQLLDVLSTGYLLDEDVAEREGHGPGTGTRRLPPTAERPYDRTIPAEVVRALEERSGGLCEFGSCERPAMETCHLEPHRDGSGREVENLVRGCRLHHKAFDAGLIRFLGWTRSEDELGAGLPAFRVEESNEILRPKPRPHAGSRLGQEPDGPPAWLLRALPARHRGRLAAPAGHAAASDADGEPDRGAASGNGSDPDGMSGSTDGAGTCRDAGRARAPPGDPGPGAAGMRIAAWLAAARPTAAIRGSRPRRSRRRPCGRGSGRDAAGGWALRGRP
jgi:hypothetical protein